MGTKCKHAKHQFPPGKSGRVKTGVSEHIQTTIVCLGVSALRQGGKKNKNNKKGVKKKKKKYGKIRFRKGGEQKKSTCCSAERVEQMETRT